MDSKVPRERPDLDLSQKWLKHLREATRTTSAPPHCSFCKDQKAFSSEGALLAHILNAHPEKVPEKDTEEYVKFKESLRSQTAPTKTRQVASFPAYSRPVWTKPSSASSLT